MNIGNEIRRIARAQGTTVHALAKAANINPSALTRIINGSRQPRIDTLEALAEEIRNPLDKAKLLWSAGYVPQELRDFELNGVTFQFLRLAAQDRVYWPTPLGTEPSSGHQHILHVILVKSHDG